jgi:hypothetical protein
LFKGYFVRISKFIKETIQWRESDHYKTSIDEVLALLTPYEETLIRLYYGIGCEKMPSKVIGRSLGGKSGQPVQPTCITSSIFQTELHLLFQIRTYQKSNPTDEALQIFLNHTQARTKLSYQGNARVDSYKRLAAQEIRQPQMRHRHPLPSHLSAKGSKGLSSKDDTIPTILISDVPKPNWNRIKILGL